ncbi:hypothetical protein CLV24_11066 [Pontibacter ummariensis]|uniref:Uncharacterized protein n=1 Tax=Pontibacter ummariensis TaxID=1610492 RepID=A0A239G681_9BACT|nr:hypothetical protein [Pontibacter ummariensis]PRY11621.1 hypothetical protein CLV24_11066 [Pontibacter ummariensis]SNS64591.1 hypothetical protein SAMN06296052_11082 [Pontibacter ummariensis]
MNRYVFWVLIILPWFILAVFLTQNRDASVRALALIMLLIHLCIVVNARRKAVGLSAAETFKAFVPLWGAQEYNRLFFQEV